MTPAEHHPQTQSHYQLRAGTADAGVTALAGAELLLWVDAFGDAEGPRWERSPDASSQRMRHVSGDGAESAAEWVLEAQTQAGRRLSVAIVTAHEGLHVPDLLLAGAVVDALCARGIDATSPEAALLGAAAAALGRARLPLSMSSVPGRERSAGEGAHAVRSRLNAEHPEG